MRGPTNPHSPSQIIGMKTSALRLIFLLGVIASTEAVDFNCKPNDSPEKANDFEPVCFVEECLNNIKHQITKELNAAFQYLYMAVYFDQDTVNRPGIAKFLYDSSSEEREHAKFMMDYLSMRGIPFDEAFSVDSSTFDKPIPNAPTYRQALKKALDMEVEVTNAIFHVAESCGNDFHAVDVFTDPILNEQHEGIRKIKGFLKTYDNMQLNLVNTNDLGLAEYLFDYKMLE